MSELCGAQHPSTDLVVCGLFTDTTTYGVHVHRGIDPADGSTHRWEDAPPDESGEDQAQ